MDGLTQSSSFPRFAAWMGAHFLAYVAVALSIRHLSTYFGIVEIAAIRSAGSLAIAGWLLHRAGQFDRSFTDVKLSQDAARSLLHLAGSLAFIWSITSLPLGFIATVEFSGPLFAALIAFLFAGRRPGGLALGGLGLIMAGTAALLVLQGLSEDLSLLVPVAAVALLTVTNLMLAELARTRSVTLIVFVMHAIQLPIYLALSVYLHEPAVSQRLVTDSFVEALLTVIAAVALMSAGFVTQAALANASRFATPIQLCAADTLRVPIMTILGFVAFAEVLDTRFYIPGLVVVAGAIIVSLPSRTTWAAVAARR